MVKMIFGRENGCCARNLKNKHRNILNQYCTQPSTHSSIHLSIYPSANQETHFKKKSQNLLFCIGVQLINNVVTVSGERGRNQAYIYIYPFSLKLPSHPGCRKTLSRVPCAIAVGPCWLSILNIAEETQLKKPFFFGPCGMQYPSFLTRDGTCALCIVRVESYWITREVPEETHFLFSTAGSDSKTSARNAGDPGSIPGLGRSPGEGNGNPLQYSCLENSMD